MSANPPTEPQRDTSPGFFDAHDQRRADRAARHEARHQDRGRNGAWIGGVILILIGIAFLAQNAGITAFTNWWAIFILIPGLGAVGAAWSMYRSRGQFDRSSLGSLGAGIVFLLIAFGFLLNVDMRILLPVALIVFGVGMLVIAFLR